MYYVRKLSSNSNLSKIKNALSIEELDADILKQELGTTGNTLSFWKCENLEELSDTFKAILLSTTAVKSSQFFLLSDDIVAKYGLEMDDSEKGSTGYSGYEYLHSNMIKLNYSKIGTILMMLHEAFQKTENTPKIDKNTAKEYIKEVFQAGLLNVENIQDSLKRDIVKFCEI